MGQCMGPMPGLPTDLFLSMGSHGLHQWYPVVSHDPDIPQPGPGASEAERGSDRGGGAEFTVQFGGAAVADDAVEERWKTFSLADEV